MKLPRIVINFKAYRESLGEGALRIALAAKRVWEDLGIAVAIAPQYVDLRDVSSLGVPTFAQHVDPVEPGPHTGSVTVWAVKEAGAAGSLVNHSEKRMRIDEIEVVVNLLRREGLTSLVCANDPSVARAVSDLGPDAVAVEPPELIGTGISVSRARPEVIDRVVSVIEGPVYVGAGISTAEDVRKATELGAYGVLLASAVVKSEDPYKKIVELAEGLP